MNMMEFIKGDVVDATEDYIVHQTCCTACRPRGLSAAIASKWPECNPYAQRVPLQTTTKTKARGNTATPETRDVPGTCRIQGRIVHLFGQYAPGKPGRCATDHPDQVEDRLDYFESALEDLARQIPHDASIAIPYKIGCGLAGGSWADYLRILVEFRQRHPTLCAMRIYHLDTHR
jgi:hypothetical protein